VIAMTFKPPHSSAHLRRCIFREVQHATGQAPASGYLTHSASSLLCVIRYNRHVFTLSSFIPLFAIYCQLRTAQQCTGLHTPTYDRRLHALVRTRQWSMASGHNSIKAHVSKSIITNYFTLKNDVNIIAPPKSVNHQQSYTTCHLCVVVISLYAM
jgi:hypothetical protein